MIEKKYTLAILLFALLYGCGSTDIKYGTTMRSSGSFESYGSSSFRQTNSAKLSYLSSITTNGNAVDIALSKDGNVAYIASGEGGLEVIDISNPARPKYIKSYDLEEYINSVEVKGNRVYASYVTENTKPYMHLQAYDISDPYHPNYIGDIEYRSSVAHYRAFQTNLMTQTDNDGVNLYQKRGDDYQKVASYVLGDHAYAVAMRGSYIFVANGRDGLVILHNSLAGSSGRFIK